MTRTVGLVVPAYRPDVDTLSTYVEALAAHVDPEPTVIRIELDAATDETERALETLSTSAPVPVTINAVARRRGKGAAITAGFEALETDVRAFADADGSTPASSVRDVIEAVVEGRANLAAGSRRHPDAVVESHQSFARKRLGDVFAWTASRVLDVSLYDYQCGAKAIDSETWAAVRTHLCEPGFAWDIELIALTHALGYRVLEVPVTWEDDPRSTVSPIGTSIELGLSLCRSRHRAKHIRGDRVHTAIANRRSQPATLLERFVRDSTSDSCEER
ncbi:glycosyltransferase [Halobacteria archaeon AArc-m2/3/4]|uniref:Glycosyltransferase n=1 Tax=Natronoglomus mannanivorans TaxID=2979990 RepID=A0ABT2QEM4_9EURY|nr:glycosyltransferase [Halobacteria archaeon AArc-m2/3/4]